MKFLGLHKTGQDITQTQNPGEDILQINTSFAIIIHITIRSTFDNFGSKRKFKSNCFREENACLYFEIIPKYISIKLKKY